MTDSPVTFHNLSDSALKAEIDIKATPDRVYAAWTEQQLFLKWFGPSKGGHLQVDRFDCAVGGRFDVTMVFADGDRVQLMGEYQELDPPKMIVFTWQSTYDPAMPNETLVTVDLAPTDIGTRLTLTHERFPTTSSRDDHRGWDPMLVRLASIVAD